MVGTQAAPAQSSGMHCHRVKGPAKLDVLHTGPRHYVYRTGTAIHKSSDGRYLLHDSEESKGRFEFFQCDSPPKGFKTSSEKHVSHGQVRSEKHPDMCLTVGGVDNRPRVIYDPNLPDNQKKGDFDKKNGILSLQPCSKDPRLQWWEFSYDNIIYIGSEADQERLKVGGDYDNHVLYTYPVKNPEKAPWGTGNNVHLQFSSN